MPVVRQWHDKGITVVADILNGIHNVATLVKINEYYNVNINVLDYHNLKN